MCHFTVTPIVRGTVISQGGSWSLRASSPRLHRGGNLPKLPAPTSPPTAFIRGCDFPGGDGRFGTPSGLGASPKSPSRPDYPRPPRLPFWRNQEVGQARFRRTHGSRWHLVHVGRWTAVDCRNAKFGGGIGDCQPRGRDANHLSTWERG